MSALVEACNAIFAHDLPELERICDATVLSGNSLITILGRERSLVQLARAVHFYAGLVYLLVLGRTDICRAPPLEPYELPLLEAHYLKSCVDILRQVRKRPVFRFVDVPLPRDSFLDMCIRGARPDKLLMYMSLGATRVSEHWTSDRARPYLGLIRHTRVMLALMQCELRRRRMPGELWRRVRCMLL